MLFDIFPFFTTFFIVSFITRKASKMGFWDLVSFGLTAQLVLTVWTHIRRIVKLHSLFTVVLCYCLSTFLHLLHLSLVAYLSQQSVGESSNDHGNKKFVTGSEKAELVFALSPFSIALLAMTFLLLIYAVEALTWLKTSFVPLIKSIKCFYQKVNKQKRILEPSIEVQPPGIDLRGKILKSA